MKTRCPACRGEMKEIKDSIKEDNVDYEAYRCTSCGEELMNMKQLRSVAAKYRRLRRAKEIVFAKWGNSVAVRIPNEIIEELKIKVGNHGFIDKDKEGIKIIPIASL